MASDHTSPRTIRGNPSPIPGNAKEKPNDMVGSFTQKGTVDKKTAKDPKSEALKRWLCTKAPRASGAAEADHPATADIAANKIEHEPAGKI